MPALLGGALVEITTCTYIHYIYIYICMYRVPENIVVEYRIMSKYARGHHCQHQDRRSGVDASVHLAEHLARVSALSVYIYIHIIYSIIFTI